MLYFLRHGLDDETFVGGWSNVALLPEGRAMVYDAAGWMSENLKIRRIITSDIYRAVETSEIVSDVLGIPFEVDSNLREQSKGILNGMEKSEAKRLYPEYFDWRVGVDTVYPGGGSLRELYEKMRSYIEKLQGMDDTLFVSHRGNINIIYYLLNGVELDMDKERFRVVHASVHEVDMKLRKIRRVR